VSGAVSTAAAAAMAAPMPNADQRGGPGIVGGGLHHFPRPRIAEKGREQDQDDRRAGEHCQLLWDDHDGPEHDRVRRSYRRKCEIIGLATPDRAGQALKNEGNPNGGQDQAHHVGLGDRPEGNAIRQAAKQEAAGDGSGEGQDITDTELDVQHPGDEAREHEEFALGEINDPGRLVDDHEAEGDEAIECSRRDTAHQQVAEQHFLLSVPICTNRHKPFSDPTF
jgi:hypothetical protein